MPEVTISAEQSAFLDELCEELQAEMRYGHVRQRDALQYLIDHFDGEDVDVRGGVAPARTADDGSAEKQAAAAVGGSDEDANGGDDDAGTPSGTESAGVDEEATTGAADGGTKAADASDDDDRLNAMMNLLDTHEDKWREAEKGDARYEVDMPDGTTEYVQTKDDVRAHLFKNY